MKIWEIELAEGKQYKCSDGIVYKVVEMNPGYELHEENLGFISDKYKLSKLLTIDFEEVVDWSKIPVDTKILVSSNGKEWRKRYFLKFEDGKVWAFGGGCTSWSGESDGSEWKFAKLAK